MAQTPVIREAIRVSAHSVHNQKDQVLCLGTLWLRHPIYGGRACTERRNDTAQAKPLIKKATTGRRGEFDMYSFLQADEHWRKLENMSSYFASRYHTSTNFLIASADSAASKVNDAELMQ